MAAGALIGIQTSYGTYRFLFPGGDPAELSRRVTAFAVRHQGPAAASTVTRVVDWGHDVERRQSRRPPPKPAGWARVQPYLVVLLLVFIASVVTLILLQSCRHHPPSPARGVRLRCRSHRDPRGVQNSVSSATWRRTP